MKTLSLTLSGVLLATSALIAPGFALAQTQDAATAQTPAVQAEPQADSQEPASVDEIVVLGRYIPEPNRESAEVAVGIGQHDQIGGALAWVGRDLGFLKPATFAKDDMHGARPPSGRQHGADRGLVDVVMFAGRIGGARVRPRPEPAGAWVSRRRRHGP